MLMTLVCKRLLSLAWMIMTFSVRFCLRFHFLMFHLVGGENYTLGVLDEMHTFLDD